MQEVHVNGYTTQQMVLKAPSIDVSRIIMAYEGSYEIENGLEGLKR